MRAPHFGTDGWRGVMADDFTFANVERVAQAAADFWRAEPPPGTRRRVVVGYDRRFLSDRFAARVAGVLAGNGFTVILTDRPTATPAVSLAVRDGRAAGGVMITASHNPPQFNGFKLKAWFGGSAGPETGRAVEARLGRNPVQRMPLAEAVRARRVQRRDLATPHLAAVRKQVDFRAIARAGLRVAHDAMHGVGADLFATLLRGTSCRVTTLRGEPDVLFGGIHPEPIPRYYEATMRWLRAHPQDVCLATDGDADRLGGLDGRGRPLTTHQCLSLLLEHFVVHRGARGRVIKSVNTTSLVDALCAEHGLPLTEVGIGFPRLCAEMRADDVLLGVEESGGIGYPPYLPDRDGIAAGMWLLELLAVTGRSVRRLLGRLERRFGPHHYDRVGLRVPDGAAETIESRLRADPPARLLRSPVERVVTLDGVKCVARDGSWLMFRRSGTEPLFRVYAEAASEERVRRLLAQGRRVVRQLGKQPASPAAPAVMRRPASPAGPSAGGKA